VADLHAAGDAADVVDDEADGIDGAAADVLGIVVGEKRNSPTWSGTSTLEWSSTRPSMSVVGQRVFEGDVAELVEFASDLERLAAVVDADGSSMRMSRRRRPGRTALQTSMSSL